MRTKTQFGKGLLSPTIALMIIISALLPVRLVAQVRGAQKLMKVETVEDLQKLDVGDVIVMTCAKCKDTYTQVVEKTYRTAKPEELKTLTIHLCDSCDTRIVTKGTGKNAKDTLVHTCKTCGSNDITCSAIKKDALPTLGTEGDKK